MSRESEANERIDEMLKLTVNKFKVDWDVFKYNLKRPNITIGKILSLTAIIAIVIVYLTTGM